MKASWLAERRYISPDDRYLAVSFLLPFSHEYSPVAA